MINEIDRAAYALHHIDAGCARDAWVKAGMAAKSAGLDFDDFHNWSASAGNYAGESECRTVWESFNESGGVTPATLYRMAIAQGWQDPAKSHINGTRPSIPTDKSSPSHTKPVKQAENGNVMQIWERCIAATLNEAYIHRKQGKPDGVKVYPVSAPPLVIRGQNIAGYLAVPCWSREDLQTIQFIPPDGGDKLNMPGASFNDGIFTVGEMTDRVYVCEGIGQAWAVNQATGAAAVVCFGAGRMMTVAKVLRDKYPAAGLVIVPDRGKEADAQKIAAAVVGQWIEMPIDKPSNYDANDYLQEAEAGCISCLAGARQSPCNAL